jgi:hypothetical protein
MFETRVRRLQDTYGDALLTSLTVLLLLLMFVVAPLRAAGFEQVQAFALVLIVALMVNALVLSGNLASFVTMLVALAMNAAASSVAPSTSRWSTFICSPGRG